MEPVADTIRHYLDNRDMHFIFPSEVVAAFWRRRALSCTNRRAVRSDRFLSWDTFKEKTFARKREEVPANSFIRICFAADLLRRNAGDSGFLHNLILPEYAGSWRPFVRSIARMLPSLDGMLQDRQAAGLLDPGLREDLTTVAGRYRRFLEAHGFYEPLHETKRIVSPLEAIIFFPEVVFDFAEHERLLLRRNSVLVTDVGPPAAATAVLYPNARVEVRKTCLACRELLDGGAIPSEIAVTLTDWNGYAEEFCDAAARYDLPVTRRAGKPLADYVEVRLYRLLSECVASGFALEVLKELFLNAAYPWRDPGKGRELVRFGIDNYGVQNLPGNGPSMDEWHGRLKAAKKPQLLEFYSRFKRGAESITGASTFPDLRAAVMAFNRGFLDTGGFGESQSLPFSAAMDVLVRIEEPAARLDDLELDSPFSLWMTYLAERRYVEPGRGNGIRLYEYRVAAGICPDHHFILGVCQEASAVRQPAYPYLPLNMVGEDVQAKGDFTESFFRLYERSGRNVVFSGSKESFDGPVTPVRRFTYADPPAVENDLYASEIRFWAGADPLLPRVHRQQLAGLEYMASTGLREKGLDLTEQPLTRVALAGRISGRLTGSKGVLRISPSNLDIWRHCRFRYLLQRVLGIEENDFDAVYTDPREAGVLFHAVFAAVLRKAARRPLLAVDTIALLDDVVASCLGTKFLPPVRNYLRRQVEEHVVAFLKTEEQWYDDTRLFTLEDSLETDPGIPGVVLRGRIDRISERQGSYIVVDYKTNVGRKVAGMVTPEGALYSFQVPVYVLLVEGNYGPVSQALYYDINKANYDSVFGGEKPWFDDEWRENLLLQTKETVAAMSQAIGESHYETPVPKGGCDPCELRSICREKYRVR